MEVIYKSENADVIYYKEKNVVLVIWNSYCELEVYRNILINALNVIKEHKCNYVADTRNGFVDNLKKETSRNYSLVSTDFANLGNIQIDFHYYESKEMHPMATVAKRRLERIALMKDVKS